MAVATEPKTEPNGHLEHKGIDPSKVLPGTTFPPTDPDLKGLATSDPTIPKPQPGPNVNGKETTLTIYSPAQLASCPCLPSLRSTMNASFSASHAKKGCLPSSIERLRTEHQFVQEIGTDPWTFTYIMTYAGTQDVIGTASAQRWYGAKDIVETDENRIHQTFKRKGASAVDAEEWELRLMAVEVGLQRQGIAGLLMRLVDEEVVRRFKEARAQDGKQGMGLVMMLTTISEINGDWYRRRGYVDDYENRFPVGWMGSEEGFGVLHMSRRIQV